MIKHPTFHKIALIGRASITGVPETLIALKQYLVDLNIQVVLEENTAELISNHGLKVVPADKLNQQAELLIVVGGDGSLLRAAHIAIQQNLPVLGINRGRLGFLTDIPPNQLEKIGVVLQGQYQEERRFLLQATAKIGEEILTTELALNDVVLLPGDIAHMIEFDVAINQQFVCSYRADGLIVSTPTGSTAYALSGGGPILHPQLDAIALVPMFPHNLNSRPIVVAGNSEINLNIYPRNQTTPHLSCDGLARRAIPPGSVIHIKKQLEQLRLIHPADYNYFETLREKLGWEKNRLS